MTVKMNIYQKLLQIQAKVNGLGKDASSGSGNYGYQYVSGTKVLEFVKPLMNDLGLILKQEILSIENDRQDYTTRNGSKSEILSKVMMKFTWIDTETAEKDENLFGANGQNDWEKGLGSALTYAERYFLLKYFHIPTDEDDIDNDLRKKVSEDKPAKPATANTSTTNQNNRQKVDEWLSEEAFEKAKVATKAQIQNVLKKYNGKPYKDGKVYAMKKEYKSTLENLAK
ncbi:ERF family protein [Riemerella columbina]|uniref:ERF family protein n=1 Tax=Riemerella columbina TaxID=103810 RepID=UPI000362ADC6|nr:ERF family protein [Riemerella columbina]